MYPSPLTERGRGRGYFPGNNKLNPLQTAIVPNTLPMLYSEQGNIMSLDLEQVALPIQELAQQLKLEEKEISQRLSRAVEVASALDQQEMTALQQRIEASRGRVRWPAAGLLDTICHTYPLPSLPQNFTVMAVDGSHIEIDRHRVVQCYLINLGQVSLHYGEQSYAALSNKPFLYWKDKDIAIEETPGDDEETVGVELLSARCSVEECRLLAKMIEELSEKEPVTALLDGSLILWGIGGQSPSVRQSLLQKGLIPALDKVRSIASQRQVALASYISSPRSTDVINAIRISLCKYDVPDCSQYCFTKEAIQECQAVGGLSDKELFGRLLSPGDRSPLFLSPASIVRKYYGEHQVAFFYLNVGAEIARVEMPCWIAEQPLLIELAHALTYDQCQRGLGYPVALSEAHQQAVVTSADRDNFWRLVERSLVDASLQGQDSAKSRSKLTRWL